jgi:hypothetical protein
VTRIAFVYYSATGNGHALARGVGEEARAGAEVRLRHVTEPPQEMLISFNLHWGRHRSKLDEPDATLDDIEWADVTRVVAAACEVGLPGPTPTSEAPLYREREAEELAAALTQAEPPAEGKQAPTKETTANNATG